MSEQVPGLDPEKVWFYILAGGKSRRLGQNKAFVDLGGKPLIQRLVDIFPGRRIAILAADPEPYSFLALPVLVDRFRGVGPMAGIHAGLEHSNTEFSFFLACDLPRMDTRTVLAILGSHRGEDFVGPQTRRGIEPLCAVYARRLLPQIEAAIAARRYGLQEFVLSLKSRRLLRFEDETVFFNLNTPEDLEELTGQRPGW